MRSNITIIRKKVDEFKERTKEEFIQEYVLTRCRMPEKNSYAVDWANDALKAWEILTGKRK